MKDKSEFLRITEMGTGDGSRPLFPYPVPLRKTEIIDIGANNMNDCIFCKIASGEIPCMKVYEDNFTLAFMDIAKDVDGHILVVPKKHFKNVLDCDEETLYAVMKTVRTVSNHLTEQCGYDGVNLLNASDESAGQSVPHLHIHIIPRKRNDGINAWPRFEGAREDIQTVFEKVKM